MNISTYIFGYLGNRYSQYPNDYTQTIFRNFYAHSSAPTQITIHREDKLIYYGYIRKLEADQYIGLCVVLNSVMLTDFKEMFSIFEDVITNLVFNGILLQLNDKGDIVSKTTQLYTNQIEVSRIAENLQKEFAKLEKGSKPLPPINYSIARNEKQTFSIDDSTDEIIRASTTYTYTYILKQQDFDTQSLSSYRGIVCRLNKEKSEITEKYADLQKEHVKVLKQKKQFQLVVFLAIAILGCGVGLFFLNDNLNMTKDELAKANKTISIRNDTIKNKDSQIADMNRNIYNLNVSLNEEQERREQIESDFELFKSSINDIQPFVVKSTSFDFYTGRLSFDYYGLRNASVSVQVKAYGDGSYSNSSSIEIEEGYHRTSIYLNNSLNSSNRYSFELIVGNKIVGGGRH